MNDDVHNDAPLMLSHWASIGVASCSYDPAEGEF